MIAESHRAAWTIPGAFWKAQEGGIVNLREAIGEYVVGYLQCHEVIGMDGDGVERIRRQAGEAGERLDCAVKVAEAAMAYMEHQAASVGDPVADEAAYYRERCRLWDAFMLAKDKAKEVVS